MLHADLVADLPHLYQRFRHEAELSPCVRVGGIREKMVVRMFCIDAGRCQNCR